MQELRPARQQLLTSLGMSNQVASHSLPIHQPGHHFLPALLDPAEALVDNIKLMQACPPSATWPWVSMSMGWCLSCKLSKSACPQDGVCRETGRCFLRGLFWTLQKAWWTRSSSCRHAPHLRPVHGSACPWYGVWFASCPSQHVHRMVPMERRATASCKAFSGLGRSPGGQHQAHAGMPPICKSSACLCACVYCQRNEEARRICSGSAYQACHRSGTRAALSQTET